MSFGHDFFSYDSIFTSNAESAVFNATDFDIPKQNSIFGTVKAKWVEATQTYHYKAGYMSDWADTGKSSASQVKDSTVQVNMGNHANGDPIVHSVKRKIDAGQGLEFDSLSPADGGSEDPNEDPVQGCMDEEATNYNPDATEDDSSCKYEENEEEINPLFLVAGAVLLVLIIK